jgi:hypothetical protein
MSNFWVMSKEFREVMRDRFGDRWCVALESNDFDQVINLCQELTLNQSNTFANSESEYWFAGFMTNGTAILIEENNGSYWETWLLVNGQTLELLESIFDPGNPMMTSGS